LSAKAAGTLNTDLGTKVLIKGTIIGGFTTTFDVTIT